MNKKALIAMSGGVDSSVAALLMQEQGYDCTGVTMKLFNNEDIGLANAVALMILTMPAACAPTWAWSISPLITAIASAPKSSTALSMLI